MGHEFQIAGIRLNEAHFSLIREFEWERNNPIEIKHNVEVGYTQTDKILQVIVSVSSNSENEPFHFSVSWEGFFDFEELPPIEDMDRIAHINCASIIFPFVRETIADLTRRASILPLNLPPFNFLAMYEEKQKKAAVATSKKPRKKRQARRNDKE